MIRKSLLGVAAAFVMTAAAAPAAAAAEYARFWPKPNAAPTTCFSSYGSLGAGITASWGSGYPLRHSEYIQAYGGVWTIGAFLPQGGTTGHTSPHQGWFDDQHYNTNVNWQQLWLNPFIKNENNVSVSSQSCFYHFYN